MRIGGTGLQTHENELAFILEPRPSSARRQDPASLNQTSLIHLQKTAGNAAVTSELEEQRLGQRQDERVELQGAFIQREASPTPQPAQPRESSVTPEAGTLATPYGNLVYPVPAKLPFAKEFNTFTEKAVESEKIARDSARDLKEYGWAEAAGWRAGETDARPGSFIRKHGETYGSEIAANTTGPVKQRAESMEQQRQMLGLTKTVLQDIELQIMQANGQLESAYKRLTSITHLAEARRLEEKAERWKSGLETALESIHAVIKLTEAIGEENPYAALEAAWEGFSVVIKLARTESGAQGRAEHGAEEEYHQGVRDAIAAANSDMDTAEETIKGAVKLAVETKSQQETSAKFFVQLRGEAEAKYDESARGAFTFEKLNKRIEWCDTGEALASDVRRKYERVFDVSDYLVNPFYPRAMQVLGANIDDERGGKWAEGLLAARDMASAATVAQKDIVAQTQRVDSLRRTLIDMRSKADLAMAQAPERRRQTP